MITPICSRWRDRRGTYRPAGEVINTRAFEVAVIADDATAKSYVLRHHYSGSYPAARFRFGLYHAGQLCGVAVFSVPTNPKSLACIPGEVADSVELGRLVLDDAVPGNGETWFLGRTFELLAREGLAGVVSFSDPEKRVDAIGAEVFGGHIGTIYQAHNATYLGRATARTLRLLPDGKVLSPRAIQKVRAGERGWKYVVDQLLAAGAAPLVGDRRAWLRAQLDLVTRPLRHGGNHKYAWALQRTVRRRLPASLPYPKFSSINLEAA